MKTGPVLEHVRNACGRIEYTTPLKIDSPWKMLSLAVLLQGALDFINLNTDETDEEMELKAGGDFLRSYRFYADLCGLEIEPEEFLGLVYEHRREIFNTKKQRTATAFLDCYI